MSDTSYLVERAKRYEKVRKMRDSGSKWKEIAAELGVSIARVSAMYMYEDNDAPESVKQEVRSLYGNKCASCRGQNKNGDTLHVHHKYGKEHTIENLLCLCRECHVFLHKLKRRKDEAYDHFMEKFSKKLPAPEVM